MTAAVITARGGSKRLPRKNVRLFCGIPLIGWAIIQAKTSKYINEVFVSTDDDEIESIAREYGASVIRRPEWPDANEASAVRPLIHAMQHLMQTYGANFNEVVAILPTSPLNKPGDFDKAIEIYRQYGCDSVRPLIPQRETMIMRRIHPIRAVCEIFDKKYKYLGEGGGWVVTSPKYYVNFNSMISDLDVDLDKLENWPTRECYFYEQEFWQHADVDTLEEFNFAQIVMEYYICKGQGAAAYFDYKNNSLNTKTAQLPLAFGNSMQHYGGD